jgi:hypothetical protein
MRRLVALVIACVGLAACGGTRSVQHAGPSRTTAARGCGATTLHRGRLPGWAEPAFSAGGTSSTPWPYGVAQHGTVVAVVFGFPLRAGTPIDRANKVLWIMRLPRRGSPLSITAAPLSRAGGGGGPRVHASWPADSGPGEIYPSYVNVPHAGCWRVTVRWAHHTDTIDLPYRA